MGISTANKFKMVIDGVNVSNTIKYEVAHGLSISMVQVGLDPFKRSGSRLCSFRRAYIYRVFDLTYLQLTLANSEGRDQGRDSWNYEYH